MLKSHKININFYRNFNINTKNIIQYNLLDNVYGKGGYDHTYRAHHLIS